MSFFVNVLNLALTFITLFVALRLLDRLEIPELEVDPDEEDFPIDEDDPDACYGHGHQDETATGQNCPHDENSSHDGDDRGYQSPDNGNSDDGPDGYNTPPGSRFNP